MDALTCADITSAEVHKGKNEPQLSEPEIVYEGRLWVQTPPLPVSAV